MVEFCQRYDVPVEICGKLIVATKPDEVPRLRALHQRALDNGLNVTLLTPGEAAGYEPHVSCRAALRVHATGIVSFATVAATMADLLEGRGTTLRTGTEVLGIRAGSRDVVVRTTAGDLTADVLVNCAGLHSDRIARMAGLSPPVQILPFRGEYFQLRSEPRALVRDLIYPVPDPALPFLGVHLARMIDGTVHAGPNAVLALARQAYNWRQVSLRDTAEVFEYPGFWRLARRHLRYGLSELGRSLSIRHFARQLAQLVPGLSPADLRPAPAGVRAQAVAPDGTLVDDFLIVRTPRQVHVLNAPSPAATSALEIAREIVARLRA